MFMANPIQLVAVATVLLCEVNQFICIYMYTATIKSLANKASHNAPL
jgi:hypothetical protein